MVLGTKDAPAKMRTHLFALDLDGVAAKDPLWVVERDCVPPRAFFFRLVDLPIGYQRLYMEEGRQEGRSERCTFPMQCGWRRLGRDAKSRLNRMSQTTVIELPEP